MHQRWPLSSEIHCGAVLLSPGSRASSASLADSWGLRCDLGGSAQIVVALTVFPRLQSVPRLPVRQSNILLEPTTPASRTSFVSNGVAAQQIVRRITVSQQQAQRRYEALCLLRQDHASIASSRVDASGGNQHDHWLTALMLRKNLARQPQL
jgi:hypothetical protein